jgi:outer membrane protein assembly factor BamB
VPGQVLLRDASEHGGGLTSIDADTGETIWHIDVDDEDRQLTTIDAETGRVTTTDSDGDIILASSPAGDVVVTDSYIRVSVFITDS